MLVAGLGLSLIVAAAGSPASQPTGQAALAAMVQLREQRVDVVMRLQAGRAPDQSVAGVVHRFGASLAPLHPGIQDPDMASWFVITGARTDVADELAAALRALPAVESAYVQPRPAPA